MCTNTSSERYLKDDVQPDWADHDSEELRPRHDINDPKKGASAVVRQFNHNSRSSDPGKISNADSDSDSTAIDVTLFL